MDMKLSEELAWRGFVHQTTLQDVSVLDTPGIKFYFGVDPSSDSMTVGNLATLLMTKRFKAHGHTPYLLVGGATGMIGDPSFKDEERRLMSPEQVAHNKQGITGQFRRIMADQEVQIVDNYDWFKDYKYLDFLRDIGKHFSLTPLLQRDYIASRIGPNGRGISYAEFSYTLIQGYDFLHLFREKGITLQVCGSDQWGNSISGVELIRRIENKEAHIWSAPLVINKLSGQKFGKTEAGAIWLDSKKTNVYDFYQFWLNVDDASVEDHLKIFTELDKSAIDQVMSAFNQDKARREAQKTLAYEVTKIVHGAERADAVQSGTTSLFGATDYSVFSEADFEKLSRDLGLHNVQTNSELVHVLAQTGLASSNTEARRFLRDGAIYINGMPADPTKIVLSGDDAILGYVVLRRGKNSQTVVKLN